MLDFGLAAGEPASRRSPKLTNPDALLGSPAYMSPERSGVWSMGALLYELRCLRKSPSDRFGSMSERASALRSASQ